MEPPSARLGCLLFLLTWLIISPSHSSRFLGGELRNSKNGGREEGEQNEKNKKKNALKMSTNTTKQHQQPKQQTPSPQCAPHNPKKARQHPLLQQSCLSQDGPLLPKPPLACETNQKPAPKRPNLQPTQSNKTPQKKNAHFQPSRCHPTLRPPSAERLPALSQTRKK